MSDPAAIAAVVAAIFLVAGVMKGIVGFGLPTVSMGLMSLLLPPVEAAAVLVAPTLVTNVWQMLAGPAFLPLLRRFGVLNGGICAGTFLTIGLLAGPSAALATAAIGAVLAMYATYGLMARRFEVLPATERWWSPPIGLATGMLCGATGVFAVPVIPYLSSVRLSRDELIQAVGISAFVSPLALGLALLAQGRYDAQLAMPSLLAVIPALGGMALGQRIRRHLDPMVFRRWFFFGLLALGGYMLLRSVWRG